MAASVRRFDASKVQGSDAFVDFWRYTLPELRGLQERLAVITKLPPCDFAIAGTQLLETEAEQHIWWWNFVDGNGEPIPVGDLGALIDGEITFVFKCTAELIVEALIQDATNPDKLGGGPGNPEIQSFFDRIRKALNEEIPGAPDEIAN